jgi:DNA topoisomerase I
MKAVAHELGNTPAVARSSYVDPRVVVAYEHDRTIGAAVRCTARSCGTDAAQAILEKATRTLIRQAAKLSSAGTDGRRLGRAA